jgi:hypothetical protein
MHHGNEAGGGDIKGLGKAVIAEEEAVLLQPGVEGGVKLEVTEGTITAEADEDTESLSVFLCFSRSVLKTAEVLGNGIVQGKISGHRESRCIGSVVDGENGIGRVNLLEFLEEVQE